MACMPPHQINAAVWFRLQQLNILAIIKHDMIDKGSNLSENIC